jgi:hypothetical protein
MGAATPKDSPSGGAVEGSTSKIADRDGWCLEFRSIGFGRYRLHIRGKAPDWAFIGLLVPFIVAANFLLHAYGTASLPSSIAASGVSAAAALLVARVTGRRAAHSRVMVGALTASGGGMIKMVIGPLVLPVAPVPSPSFVDIVDLVAGATLAAFIVLHVVRELLTRIRPASRPGPSATDVVHTERAALARRAAGSEHATASRGGPRRRRYKH